MKDPAFLFYSKDFYEGTRMMLPEERACYIDLLIYQHQNGNIPLDLKRVVLYCSNIDKATLEATLEAKFIKTENGWYNERLKNEILNRESYKSSQSDNGKVGQFWKKAKQILKAKEFFILHNELKNKEFILNFIDKNEINISTLKGLLKQCLNNKGSVNVDEDVNVNIDLSKKDKTKKTEIEFKPPTLEEFINYAQERLVEVGKTKPEDYTPEIMLKFHAWNESGWKKEKDGKLVPILNWKTTLNNTLGFFKGKSENPPSSGRTPLTTMQHNIELSKQMGILKSQTYYEPIQIQITDEQD